MTSTATIVQPFVNIPDIIQTAMRVDEFPHSSGWSWCPCYATTNQCALLESWSGGLHRTVLALALCTIHTRQPFPYDVASLRILSTGHSLNKKCFLSFSVFAAYYNIEIWLSALGSVLDYMPASVRNLNRTSGFVFANDIPNLFSIEIYSLVAKSFRLGNRPMNDSGFPLAWPQQQYQYQHISPLRIHQGTTVVI